MSNSKPTATIKIKDDILAILSEAVVERGVVVLKCGQLDRKTYTEVNKVLECLGGKWNRGAKGHTFTNDPTEILESALLFGEVTDLKKQYQFFPTPKEAALRLIELAEIKPGMSVLEPSAGQGAIADLLPKPDVVELNPGNIKLLVSKGYEVLSDDFLRFEGSYDRIVANPPFARQQDLAHVAHMMNCLSDEGRLVSVMANGVLFRTDKATTFFKGMLTGVEKNGGSYRFEQLPEGSFSSSGTGVNTCIIIVQMP